MHSMKHRNIADTSAVLLISDEELVNSKSPVTKRPMTSQEGVATEEQQIFEELIKSEWSK